MLPNSSRPKLPSTYFRLLKAGDTHNEYRGAPGLIGAIVGIAVDCGVSVDRLVSQLLNPNNPAAYEVMHSGRVREENVRQWYAASAAQQQLQPFDIADYRRQIGELRESATLGTWRGKYTHELESGETLNVYGSVLRRVLHAHLMLALNNPGIDYPASERAIAQTAGVSRPAAKRATQLLKAFRVIRSRRAPGKWGSGTASWYRIDASGGWLASLLTNEQTIDANDLARFECHAVFRHGNGVRFDVWAYMVAIPDASLREIAAATGANMRTVRRVIRRMEALGMIDRGVAPLDIAASLDIAATASGMKTRAEKQARQYETDRRFHAITILRRYGPHSRIATRHRRVQRYLTTWIENRRIDYETGEVVDVA